MKNWKAIHKGHAYCGYKQFFTETYVLSVISGEANALLNDPISIFYKLCNYG